jgi:branched-chain amino acid transport system ATP-binding protein
MDILELIGITKIFGGLTALENVSLSIEKGAITGIIGPNGAGKTTLFNIISGIYLQTSGEVYLEKRKVSGFMPERLAELGLMRTFQNVELFGEMTVLENVMVGLHTKSTSGFLSCALKLPGQIREERRAREKSLQWLEYVGMADLAQMRAESLPFGKGRLLEIARALAVEPRLILLDEPAAGLNSRETIELAALIRKIRESGITVTLVEHDMDLVMDVCDSLIVLNLGRKLAEGTPREIQENPEVITAYLGEG